MVWVEEPIVVWNEDNMEAEIKVDKDNVTMKFDVPLVGTDAAEAEEKIQVAIDNSGWASFGRYNNIEVAGNVVTKDGSLHYIGTLTTERRTMTGKADSEELCRFLGDMLEFSGIRKWPKGSTNKELKEEVKGFRECISDQYKIIDSEYNKERLDFLTRENLEKFYGDRDLANRNNVTFDDSSMYAHNSTYGRVLQKRDLFIEKGGKKYRLITINELLAMLYAANDHQITIEENLFNCNGKSLFIDSGSTITVKDGYNKCLDIVITKDGKTQHAIGYK